MKRRPDVLRTVQNMVFTRPSRQCSQNMGLAFLSHSLQSPFRNIQTFRLSFRCLEDASHFVYEGEIP